jgi:hypothetical protein
MGIDIILSDDKKEKKKLTIETWRCYYDTNQMETGEKPGQHPG